jgi:hypothetical protein
VDHYNDNKAIELQLTESIRMKQTKLDQIKADYEKKKQTINDHYDEKHRQMQELHEQLSNAPMSVKNLMFDNIKNIMTGFKELHDSELAKLELEQSFLITETEESTKKLTQSIYHNTIVEGLLNKLDNPSFDLELGLALGILLRHDPTYSNNENASKDSKDLLKQYFQKELVKADTYSQRIFEEHLISNARSILLSMLADKATSITGKKKDFTIEPKPGHSTIKLTDTDIRHSFTLI